MYFEEVLPALRNGEKVRRAEWRKSEYIYIKDGCLCNNYNSTQIYNLNFIITKNDWEIYKEEIDWEYIKNNKCLCFFWDNETDKKQIGYLTTVHGNKFYLEAPEDCFNSYSCCRPVQKGEVTFYKEDE